MKDVKYFVSKALELESTGDFQGAYKAFEDAAISLAKSGGRVDSLVSGAGKIRWGVALLAATDYGFVSEWAISLKGDPLELGLSVLSAESSEDFESRFWSCYFCEEALGEPLNEDDFTESEKQTMLWRVVMDHGRGLDHEFVRKSLAEKSIVNSLILSHI